MYIYTSRKPRPFRSGFSLRLGGDLLSHSLAVSSARQGLTSLFGMGRGAPLRNGRHFFMPEGPCGGGKATRTRHASRSAGMPAPPPSPAADGRAPRRAPRASFRAISAARLSASLRSHLRPIDAVVYRGPQRTPHLGAGFALRCLQRLSLPDAATRRCVWRRNRCTVGPSGPVLSY